MNVTQAAEVAELKQSIESLKDAVVLLAKVQGTRLIRDQMCQRLDVHRNTLSRWIEDGIVPRPHDAGKWLLSKVLEWEMSGELMAVRYKPEKPGFHLYRHFDGVGTLLYVGVSISAITRLSAHKQQAHWFWNISRVEIENFETRQCSLDAEKKAIQSERPLFNIVHSVRKKA